MKVGKAQLLFLFFLLNFLINTMICSFAESVYVTGYVAWENSDNRLEGVECQISKEDSIISTTKTDSYGNFRLQSEPAETLILTIISNHFEPYVAELKNINQSVDLGGCFVKKSQTLEEVVVEAKNVVTSKGRTIYYPRKSDTQLSTRANELIARMGIPGVMYNPISGSVSVYGSNPVILVNGIPATQQDLKSIKSSDVINVEYSNVVPLMYASRGDYLINIKVNKPEVGGSFDI